MENIDNIKKRVSHFSDQKAFKKLFYFYYKRLVAFSLRFLKSKELSEEVVLDVLMELWKNRETLIDIKNLDTYLYKSVRNRCLNTIKLSLSKSKGHISIDEKDLDFAIDNFTPENAYKTDELHKTIQEIVNNLPLAYKSAFLLVKEDGLSYKEAAEILGISPLTVKKQSLIAIKRIRKTLSIKEDREAKRIDFYKISKVITPFFLLLIKNFPS